MSSYSNFDRRKFYYNDKYAFLLLQDFNHVISILAKNNFRGETYMKSSPFTKPLLSLNLFLALLILTFAGCATTTNASKSAEDLVTSITTLKKAKKLAEPYNMAVIYDNSDPTSDKQPFSIEDAETKDFFLATNKETKEAVCYVTFGSPSNAKIQFVYLSINGEQASNLSHIFKIHGENVVLKTYLTNYNEACKLKNSYYATLKNVDAYTKELISIRNTIESYISDKFKFMSFEEPIHQHQQELMKE